MQKGQHRFDPLLFYNDDYFSYNPVHNRIRTVTIRMLVKITPTAASESAFSSVYVVSFP